MIENNGSQGEEVKESYKEMEKEAVGPDHWENPTALPQG